ncbi:MAG: FecR domain-containing protein [Rhodoferax sp.]|nr:FecR domain-containing protein [Rhodoferax sp.]
MTAASSAARAVLALVLWAACQLAWAVGEAGTVERLLGTVSAQAGNGSLRILSQGSRFFPGEIILTETDSAANLRFADGAKLALRANSRLVVERYDYSFLKPEEDNIAMRLLKGGMRTVTGLAGKRSPASYKNQTLVATVGIRGTDYALLMCAEADGACTQLQLPARFKSNDGTTPPGLYLSVFEGAINAANNAGNKDFASGKHGYVRDIDTLPVEIGDEPGLSTEFLGFHGIFNLSNPWDANPEACLVK